jgi:hypothetical protein
MATMLRCCSSVIAERPRAPPPKFSILDAGDKPSGSSNAFVADDDHGAARIGGWEGSWAEMKWLSPERPPIRYAAKSRPSYAPG